MPALTTQRVLVIEDNAMNANVLRENLLEAGYSFIHAVNGAAGLAAAAEQLPDIILMDVNLPLLDGLTATRLLKKHSVTQGIPIVALTAKAMMGDRENCLAAGCDDYISKPVDMEILLAKMKHHLDRRPPAFVDMLRRMRSQAESQRPVESSQRPGMDHEDYEEELAGLNKTISRIEGELSLVRAQRDAAQGQAEREMKRAMRLTIELQEATTRLQEASTELERLKLQIAAPRSDAMTPAGLDNLSDELARTVQHNRQLSLHLDLAQARIEELEQTSGSPGASDELRAMRSQNDQLRKALLQLHDALQSAGDAAHASLRSAT